MTIKQLNTLANPPLPKPLDIRLVKLAQSRMQALADYRVLIEPLYVYPELENVDKKEVDKLYTALHHAFPFTPDKILKAMKGSGVKTKRIYTYFYGKPTGLPLHEIIPIFGFMWMQNKLFRYL